MVDDELTTAIRNALAHREPLEKAKQSLINAGYSKQEVEEAANQVIQAEKTGIKGTIVPVASSVQTSPFAQAAPKAPETLPASAVKQTAQELTQEKANKKALILIIILSIIALSIATFLIIKFV